MASHSGGKGWPAAQSPQRVAQGWNSEPGSLMWKIGWGRNPGTPREGSLSSVLLVARGHLGWWE